MHNVQRRFVLKIITNALFWHWTISEIMPTGSNILITWAVKYSGMVYSGHPVYTHYNSANECDHQITRAVSVILPSPLQYRVVQ